MGLKLRQGGAQTACRWGWDADFCTVPRTVISVYPEWRFPIAGLVMENAPEYSLQLICPRKQSLQNRFCLFQTPGIAFFCCHIGKLMLQFKQLCKIAQCFGRLGGSLLLLWNRMQCLIKFPPRMRPAANYPDPLRELMIARYPSACSQPLNPSRNFSAFSALRFGW